MAALLDSKRYRASLRSWVFDVPSCLVPISAASVAGAIGSSS